MLEFLYHHYFRQIPPHLPLAGNTLANVTSTRKGEGAGPRSVVVRVYIKMEGRKRSGYIRETRSIYGVLQSFAGSN